MKKTLTKSLVLVVAIFLSVLFMAPAMIHAAGPVLVSVTVTPEYGEIPALGQSVHYTATAHYDDDTTADVTGTATWAIFDPSIASNDGGGVFKATAEGNTWITATFDGVIGSANLNIWRPGLGLNVGLPDETTWFNIWASGCSGLAWSLDVTGPVTYSASGTIGSNDWNSSSNSVLSAGNYVATFSVGGTVQDVQPFTVWEHTASLNIDPGFSGEETTITLNATNSDGGAVYFEILKYIPEGNYWIFLDQIKTNVVGDLWSYSIPYTLEKGLYWATFAINNRWEDGKEFSIVDRGKPQPPVVEKPAPVEKHNGPSGPSINEKPITDYHKTGTGLVTRLYNRLLKRAPEKAGLDTWIGRLTSGGLTGADLVNQFIFGVECQKIISGYANTEFITFLYKALFNRAPDTGGFNAWLARMGAGVTKEEVVNGFTHSLEFELICKNFGIKPYQGYTGTGK